MLRWQASFSRTAAAMFVLCAVSGLAVAQDDTGYPPVIVDFSVSTTPCSSETPWDPGDASGDLADDDCLREGQILYICLEVQDLDWADDDVDEDQGILLTMTSMWDPYIVNTVVYGPEPPSVTTDRSGNDWSGFFDWYYRGVPASGTSREIELEFIVPEFQGSNQAKLRGLIDYDVLWAVELTVRNGSPDGPASDDAGPSDVVFFDVCAIENPALNPGNPPPFADAGGDQVVEVGSTVILDGSASYDGSNIGFSPQDPEVYAKDALSYTWEWMTGPVRVDPFPDDDDNPATVAVTLDRVGTYEYRLLVEDGINPQPSTDMVTIEVRSAIPENRAPRADIAGPTDTVILGSTIELNATDSADPDGDPLEFRWRQTNELGGYLSTEENESIFQPLRGLTEPICTWQATQVGTFYFRLLVTDPSGLSDSALVAVEVVDSSSSTAGAVEAVAAETVVADLDASDPEGQEPSSTAPPVVCGGGMLPLAMLPVLLWLLRGRLR